MRTKFQRRHYAAIAKIIARARARAKFNDCPAEAVADLEQEFVDLFRADNPRFSPSRFIAAANTSQDARRMNIVQAIENGLRPARRTAS